MPMAFNNLGASTFTEHPTVKGDDVKWTYHKVVKRQNWDMVANLQSK